MNIPKYYIKNSLRIYIAWGEKLETFLDCTVEVKCRMSHILKHSNFYEG
jgi:hypothetical protein